MELYNATVPGCYPDFNNSLYRTVLFTWGTNRYRFPSPLPNRPKPSFLRNAVLGHADGADRQHPEQVTIRRENTAPTLLVADRFEVEQVRHVSMAKLHTGRTLFNAH
jgi:hypothetical protein